MHVILSRKQNWTLKAHKHPFIQIIWVTQGTLNITHLNMEYQLRRGHLCIIPPGLVHSLRTENGYSQLGIDLSTEKDRRGIVSLIEAHVKDFTILEQTDGLSVVEELEQNSNRFTVFSQLKAANILDAFLLNCMETLDSAGSFRNKMLFFLNQHLTSNLTLEDISRQMAFSSSHLQKIVNKEFGCSVQELYHRLKLNKACSLLTNTELTMQQIADSLGFYDQAHFSRFFKQKMKIAPLEYKKTNEM
jgi:AraC-like DNA-binding protein